MEIISSFQSEVPICRQIAGEAGERLAAGRFPPGEQLPPGRKTAAPIGVNFKTVARAYRPLEGQGMISTPTGGGLSFPFRFPVLIWRRTLSAGKKQPAETCLEAMHRVESTEEEISGWIERAARKSRAEDGSG